MIGNMVVKVNAIVICGSRNRRRKFFWKVVSISIVPDFKSENLKIKAS